MSRVERRFTTIEQTQLVVVKRSGVIEPFNRDKVITGVRKACKGRLPKPNWPDSASG